MTHGSQDNAMAEIALALAMAFFSIMVLTFVSMGGGASTAQTQSTGLEQGLVLSPSEQPSKNVAADDKQGVTETVADNLLIYFKGRFYDAGLKETDPQKFVLKYQKLSKPKKGGLVLAVDPDISITQALEVEKKVKVSDKTVTTLDARWITSLKGLYR